MLEFFKESSGWALGALALLSVFVEITPIKWNPLTSLFSWIGCRFTASLNSKLDALEKQQKENSDSIEKLRVDVEERFVKAGHDADEKEARRLRAAMLSFSDSCRSGARHTKAQFENVARDYDDYLSICSKRNLQNHFIDSEMEYVKEVYNKCLHENSFSS